MSALEEIRDRAEAATEGPWWTPSRMEPAEVFSGTGVGSDVCVATESTKADAEFIAHARTDVPRLLAALDAVTEVHTPFVWDFGFGPVASCMGCANQGASEAAAEYPCPTVRAITEALEGTK